MRFVGEEEGGAQEVGGDAGDAGWRGRGASWRLFVHLQALITDGAFEQGSGEARRRRRRTGSRPRDHATNFVDLEVAGQKILQGKLDLRPRTRSPLRKEVGRPSVDHDGRA